jgi:hypothetical protein
MVALAVDGLIVLLLLAALGLGFRLHGAVQRLRHPEGELDRLVRSLDGATERAQAALAGLRQLAEEGGQRVAGEAKALQALLDDLKFLAARGEQIADRLEADLGAARGLPAAGRAPSAPAANGARRRPPSSPALDPAQAGRTPG